MSVLNDIHYSCLGAYNFYADTSIEAPPSVWPQKHYCGITGLEVGPVPHPAFLIS